MASVKEHYDELLGEIYTWAFGGFEESKCRNEEFFKSKNITPKQSGIACDLGAGAGQGNCMKNWVWLGNCIV